MEQLQRAGFTQFQAFRLSTAEVDWQAAVRLLERGATQQEVLDLLL